MAYSQQARLQAESAVRGPVSFQILHPVFQPDFVSLQKTVQFVSCLDSQQPAELDRGKLVFPVGLKSESFDNAPG